MSDPRAIPDEERPFIPEEQIPAKESTDFDTTQSDSAGADGERGPEPAESHE